MVQVTPLLYEVLKTIDGNRDVSAIASEVSERIGKLATPDDIRFLVETKLRPLGMLRQMDDSQPALRKSNPLLGLRWRKIVTNQEVTRRLIRPFVRLFSPQVVVPVLIAFALTSGWVLFDKGLASAVHQALYEPNLLLLLFGLTMLSTGFHEFGHAAACRYGGATPGVMGVGLYLIWPAFYTDVTDSYCLSRAGRLRVDLGGLYFNAIFAVAMLGLWGATGWDALLLIIPAQLLQMLRQLVPLVRFDGYHILADLTGVPDLFSHIKPILLDLLPARWGSRDKDVLKPWVRLVVTLWVLIVVPVLILSLLVMVKVMPIVAATAWDSLGVQWESMNDSWIGGDAPSVAVAVLSMFTIALPVIGMTYLLGRIVLRAATKVWRLTAGRLVVRTLTLVAAVAGIGLLAWFWWPDGQYRPIESHESGTLQEIIVPDTASAPAPAPVSSVTRAANAAPLAPPLAVVGESSPSLPTPVFETDSEPDSSAPSHPKKVDSSQEPAWVFPFNPPSAPDHDDNQALAINTQDGTTLYDVALTLLWLTGGEDVDQVNEAWALASCRECRTVAVAFQAILVVGGADVITPQNIAVAVNYLCAECQTYALAIQFVATLNGTPSEDAMAKLALIEDRLEELARNIESIPLDSLDDELAAIEAQILEILVQDSGAVPEESPIAQDTAADTPGTEETSPGGTEEATDSATTPAVESSAPDESTDSGGESTPSEPSPAPSEDPTSEEPTPTPSEEPTPSPAPTP
jgi:putative peptide zinc metalloprotease protein